MKRRVSFKKKSKFEIQYLANFSLFLSFHESNILIKFSFFPCYRQSLESMDLTSKQFELRIP